MGRQYEKMENQFIFPGTSSNDINDFIENDSNEKEGNRYLYSYNTMHKVCNYYLGFTGDKKIVYDNLYTNEKYSNLLQMFTDNHLELKVKYGFYNFLPENLIVISCVHPRGWCSGCKPHADDSSELLKRINRAINCSWDAATSSYTDTDLM
jgi:hypothetical protein